MKSVLDLQNCVIGRGYYALSAESPYHVTATHVNAQETFHHSQSVIEMYARIISLIR